MLILYSYISESNHNRLLSNFLHKLPIDFVENILSYKKWQDVQLRLLGRLLLIKGLKVNGEDFSDLIIEYTKYGKPYFKNSNIKFNISYSGNIVVCVLTNCITIGIDIEKKREICLDYYKNQFSKAEFLYIEGSENKYDFFLKLWTRKEAIIKANGMGISIPLNSFEVINNIVSLKKKIYYLNEIKIASNYTCSVATEKNINLHNLKIDNVTF